MSSQTVSVKRKEVGLTVTIPKPELPEKWDYDESVSKVKARIYKWSKLTVEMLCELWIAREKLSKVGNPDFQSKNPNGANAPVMTWSQYCEDIGSTKSTVNRWLAKWFDESMAGKLTGNAENYTPQDIVDGVRAVLGEIDLDPASCEMAQRVVGAKEYYTREDDGLSKPWHGRVFLNPPYGMPDIRNFTDKLISELPHLRSAVLLTNDQTDTAWWQKCARHAKYVCFTGRIGFYTPTIEKTSPTNGQSIMYFGKNGEGFLARFQRIGPIAQIIA